MRVNDAITGLLVLGLAIFVFIHSGTFPAMPGVPYGPSVFPRVISGVLALGGVVLILSGMRTARRGLWLQLDAWARQPRSYGVFLAIVGSLVFYILFSEALGFLLISFVILLVLLLITRGVSRIIMSILASAAFTVVIFLVFGEILRVPLPWGIAERMLLG